MRNLTDVIGEVRRGSCLAELNEEYQKVVRAVQETGKPGELKLTLKIKPNGDTLFVDDDIATKVPKPPKSASLFFADGDGGLHRRDPNQTEMPLTSVAGVDDRRAAAE